MPKQPLVTTKHQVYRARGKEVVLHEPAAHSLDSEGRPDRVTAWSVREVVGIRDGEYLLGVPYEVPAGDLSLLGKAIPVTEPEVHSV